MVTLSSGVAFHVREVTPKDFYLAQVLRQEERSQIVLIERLILNPDCLDVASSADFRNLVKWASENLLQETILTVENWLEIAFHLCKQRWDSSIDWMESQPISKVNLMISIMNKHAEDQEKEMKKSTRRKK